MNLKVLQLLDHVLALFGKKFANCDALYIFAAGGKSVFEIHDMFIVLVLICLQPSLSFGGFGSTPSTQTPNAFQFPSFQPTQQGEFEISGVCILASQSCDL